MKKITYILVFLLLVSCDDFLDHPVAMSLSDDNIGEVLANDPSQIAGFLSDAYRKLAGYSLYGREFANLPIGMSHEQDLDYIADETWNQFYRNDVSSSNSEINRYRYFYAIIYTTNTVINFVDMIDKSELSSTVVSEMNNYKGEALFLRAFCHFMLLNHFGENGPLVGGVYPNNKDAKGIILMTDVSTSENVIVARSTVGESYEAIVSDLKAAKEVIGDNQIPTNYVVRTPGSEDADYTKDYGWAQKPAVIALLGKVYLYMNEYEKAKVEFESVIADGRFGLDKPVNFTDYIQHTDNNIECIFSFQYFADATRTNVYAYAPLHSLARIQTDVPSAWKNSFVDKRSRQRFGNDPRIYEATIFDHTWSAWCTSTTGPEWTTVDTSAADFRCYVRKVIDFYNYTLPRDNTKNVDMIRLGDVYLMYAEAALKLGDVGVATEYINKLRRRAWNESDYDSPGTQGEDFSTIDLSILQHERFKELFGENSRWYDMCRWEILETELAKYPTTRAGVVNYNPSDYYWPMPESQLKTNTLMEQSVGY